MQTFTETEVSNIFKCTKAALRKWRREKRGPRFLRIGRLIRYRDCDIEAFLEGSADQAVASPDHVSPTAGVDGVSRLIH